MYSFLLIHKCVIVKCEIPRKLYFSYSNAWIIKEWKIPVTKMMRTFLLHKSWSRSIIRPYIIYLLFLWWVWNSVGLISLASSNQRALSHFLGSCLHRVRFFYRISHVTFYLKRSAFMLFQYYSFSRWWDERNLLKNNKHSRLEMQPLWNQGTLNFPNFANTTRLDLCFWFILLTFLTSHYS